MASRGLLGSRVAATLAVLIVLVVGAPAIPANACTRIGGVTVGECRHQPGEGSTNEARPSPETILLRMLNDERTSRGLRALRPDHDARAMAEQHARRMARRGRIYHNPELGTAAGRRRLGSPGIVGENVGVGPSARAIHAAFMKSSKHRRNIVHRGFRLAGIGAFRQGDSLWVVEVFLTRSDGASSSSSTPVFSSSHGDRPGGSASSAIRSAAGPLHGMAVGAPTRSVRVADPLGWTTTATISGRSSMPALLVGIASLALGLALLRRRPQIARSNA